MIEIITLDGSGDETTEEPVKHLMDWHNLQTDVSSYGEGDLAAVHDRLHANRDEMAELDEEHWHAHPLPV